MQYARTITVDLGYEQAVEKVKEAFQAQGFGTLTEIDVRATLKEKLGQDMEPYVILGACNPQLAHRALDIERDIGLLLPCNVVVRAAQDATTLVQALDPQVRPATGTPTAVGLRGDLAKPPDPPTQRRRPGLRPDPAAQPGA